MRVSGVPYDVELDNYLMKFKYEHTAQIYDRHDNSKQSDVVTKEVVYTDCASWREVLKDYLVFLGNVYGYDITEQVEIHDYTPDHS